MASLRAEEVKYKNVFYCQKQNDFYLVKSCFRLLPQKRIYFDFYDGNIFGKHIAKSKTKSWVYLGQL